MYTIVEWVLLAFGFLMLVGLLIGFVKALRWPTDEYDVTPKPRPNVRRIL